ncbi:MAG TPA: amidase [Pyrinomonadaceae bacterium]|jgi:Asp-tRNA(Asn)/Glu-tRNA(Gln) amidotransferase A subunit family amidase
MKNKTPRRSRQKSGDSKNAFDRRTFVKTLPALSVAGLAVSNLSFSSVAQTPSPTPPPTPTPSPSPSPSPTPPPRITKEMLHTAEKLIGIELTDAQEAMALGGVNRNLDSYETVRKIDIPLDTEPAIAFHPVRAKKQLYTSKTKFHFAQTVVPQFKSVEDLAFATVPQLAELIRTRKVSSTELTKMYLARLKRFGPKLLCVVTLTEDLALKQAADADADLKRGKYRGPLHGIPWGAKDLFATKGIKTTWGAEPYRDQVIDYDATVVERLRDAGAVLVAKLSMGALAQGPRWFEGVTRNPWVPNESQQGSSGSSAGPASATAAGLVGFSIGTETLGSIVSPSSRCGCTGLRPTYGRVSRYGAMGLSWTMDKIGPICRGVEDCAAALHALYGPDGRDITVGDAPFNWNPDTNISTLRIGYLKAEFEPTPNPQMSEQQRQQLEQRRGVYQTALGDLKKAGAKLQPIELPKFSTGALRYILSAEAATAFDDITRDGRVNQLSGQAPGDWPNTFRTSRFITAVEYLRAQRARTLLMMEMEKLMSQWDVFVSPAPGSASLLITNLTGHPAVVLPCGFVKDRGDDLPVAIMFTGGVYDEVLPLRVALAYERATNWHTMHPKMDFA